MNHKPITPKVHGILDYGFTTALFLAPKLFRLRGAAKAIAYGLGSSTGTYTVLSDYPVSLRRKIPFATTHKMLDECNLAALLILPLITGAMRRGNARQFFIGIFAAGLVNVLLTDWNGNTNE